MIRDREQPTKERQTSMERASEISGAQTTTGQSAPQPQDRNDPAPSWQARSDDLCEQHWQLGQELLDLGRSLLGLIRQEPQSAAYLAQVHRLLKLGAELGRHSATDALSRPAPECPACCAERKEWEAALNKIYGKPLPGEETPANASTGTESPGGSKNPAIQLSSNPASQQLPSRPHSTINLQPSTR
jgi:hypothetical protein